MIHRLGQDVRREAAHRSRRHGVFIKRLLKLAQDGRALFYDGP